jgi:hypothetical protein
MPVLGSRFLESSYCLLQRLFGGLRDGDVGLHDIPVEDSVKPSLLEVLCSMLQFGDDVLEHCLRDIKRINTENF